MKTSLVVGVAAALSLTGCVVAPVPEPVVYQPPPAAVVVRPAYGPRHYHPYYGPYRRGWYR